MKKVTFITMLLIILTFVQISYAEDIFELEVESCQDTFLYGSEVGFRITITNLTGEKLVASGIWDGMIVYESGTETPPFGQINATDIRFELNPFEEKQVFRGFRNEVPYGIPQNQDNPRYLNYFPEGDYKAIVRAIAYIPGSFDYEAQWRNSTCDFSVRQPVDIEKEIFDQYHELTSDSGRDILEIIQDMEHILETHPESDYADQVYIALSKRYSHLSRDTEVDYNLYKEKRKIWIDWYLEKYPNSFRHGMRATLGNLVTHYRLEKDQQALTDHLHELMQQHPGTHLESIIRNSTLNYTTMSKNSFNLEVEKQKD